MGFDEASAMLNQRVSSAEAVGILKSIDPIKTEIFGVEGFILREDGIFESKLDLMFDISCFQNLFLEEKLFFVLHFVENRVGKDVYFEIYGE